MNILKTEIGLTNGKKFVIFHNVPQDNIQGLVKTWLRQGESLNPKSFVEYLTSIGYTAFTEKQFKRQGISTRKIK